MEAKTRREFTTVPGIYEALDDDDNDDGDKPLRDFLCLSLSSLQSLLPSVNDHMIMGSWITSHRSSFPR